MKKIKLMVITPRFYPKIGGLENYAFNLSKGLMKDYNYEIIIVTSNHKSKEYKEETIKGMKIYRLPYQFKVSNTPISFKWKKQIKEIIEKEKPDVINAHTPVPFISDVACRVAYKKEIPFILNYHNDLIKNNLLLNLICKSYYLFMGNRTLNQSIRLIALSEYYSKNSSYLKKRQNKIVIISPGVNFPNNSNFKKIKNRILFVGQLDKTHHHKGLDYLIEAIKIVKEKIKDVKLNIIGNGDNIQKYKNQVIQLALIDWIKFLGKLSDKELSKQYEQAEIIVLPSYNSSEGFGMVLIEGMAHKCVAIGTKVGGIPYVINNRDGLLVPPKNSQALADAIIKILKNPKLAKQMGEQGYRKVKENFTWDTSTEKMNKLIKELLK